MLTVWHCIISCIYNKERTIHVFRTCVQSFWHLIHSKLCSTQYQCVKYTCIFIIIWISSLVQFYVFICSICEQCFIMICRTQSMLSRPGKIFKDPVFFPFTSYPILSPPPQYLPPHPSTQMAWCLFVYCVQMLEITRAFWGGLHQLMRLYAWVHFQENSQGQIFVCWVRYLNSWILHYVPKKFVRPYISTSI